MSKLDFNDTFQSAVSKLSDGNPGAIGAMMDIAIKTPEIDPQCAFGEFGPLLSLDTHEIYGSDIYILYNDKCDRNARNVHVLLRAVQLGIMEESQLQALAADQMRSVNLSDEEFNQFDKEVCDQLDEFQRKQEA